MIKTIDFEGAKVKYDDSVLGKWSVNKALMDPVGQYAAIDKILCGKSDEVASKLGDDQSKMVDLVLAIVQTNGNAGKN